MGYNVNTTGVNFTIPADKLEAATQALKDMNKECPGNFAWMPANYHEEMDTAEEILAAVGFEPHMNEDGSLDLGGFVDKSGDEEQFLITLAPFVPAGSYVNWEGEDGAHWQDYFDGEGGHVQKSGFVVYQ